MKRIAVVLCMAACGLMTLAQAQKVKNLGVRPMKNSEVKVVKMEDMSAIGAFHAKAGKAAEYDTLHWHDEYNEESDKCGYGIYTRWAPKESKGWFDADKYLHAWGSNRNMTGEVGVSFITRNNTYGNYSGHELDDYCVVGAVARVFRMGNTNGWQRVGTSFTTHTHTIKGVKVPDLPYVMKGYEVVEEQETVEDYFVDENINTVVAVMPLSKSDIAYSKVEYMPYSEETNTFTDGSIGPKSFWYGGMFVNKIFKANKDFGISFEIQLTGDRTYDSLWCLGMVLKTDEICAFPFGPYLTWSRIDYSPSKLKTGWHFWKPEYEGVNVADTMAENGGGWALPGCPQYGNDSSLFVLPTSQGLVLGEGDALPMLYPIIQDRAAIESKDTYAMTVSVYPVPAVDEVTFAALDAINRIEIYNMAGALVKYLTPNENAIKLDVSDWMPGAYVAKIMTGKGVASKKLIVK